LILKNYEKGVAIRQKIKKKILRLSSLKYFAMFFSKKDAHKNRLASFYYARLIKLVPRQ